MPLPPDDWRRLKEIGAGGMGEVYQARDTRLNRQVAIKVLLPAVANDPDRLARFSREAQVLASLNHPHIAQIHGLEDADGVRALVMELESANERRSPPRAHKTCSPCTMSLDCSCLSWRQGDAGALDRLVPLVYDELRRVARRHDPEPGRGIAGRAGVQC